MENYRTAPTLSTDSLTEGLREGIHDYSDVFEDSDLSGIGSIEFSFSSIASYAASEPVGNNSNQIQIDSTGSVVNTSMLDEYPIMQIQQLSINSTTEFGSNEMNTEYVQNSTTDVQLIDMKHQLKHHFDVMQIIDLSREYGDLPDVLQEVYNFNRDFLGFNIEGFSKVRHIQDSFHFLASMRTPQESPRNILIGTWMRELHNNNIMALSECSFFVYLNSSPLTKNRVAALFSEFAALFV